MPASSILSGFEWDDGMTMPVANAENKFLEEQIQNKQRQLSSLENELTDHEDRLHAMGEHLKNVRQELKNTQGLVSARKKEIETEEHLKKVAERENGRLGQEIKRLQKDLDELKEKKNIYENNIFKQTQKLEELKAQMNWDQQALEAWLEESARKDEDAMTLQKYTRFDESKIKELSLQIEHLTDESHKYRKNLDNEVTETLTTQIELDKTAEEFRKAHDQRQELISQWEQTIDQMQKRDKDMDLLAAQLAKAKAEVRAREETIKEKQQFLDNEVENNREQEKRISIAERTAAKLRIDLQAAEAARDQFQSELEALKRTVDRTAVDLESTRSLVTQLKKDVQDKIAKLEQAKQNKEALIDKLKVAIESKLSAEERAARMDELMEDEEKRQIQIEVELKRLRELQFKKAEELHATRTAEKDCEAQIQGSRAALRNLSSKINKLDVDSLKQQEIIYNQDFNVQQLERRLSRMQGEQSNEEKLQLEAKIKTLTNELEEKSSTHHLVNLQLKRLQDDVRRVKRDVEKNTEEKQDFLSKIQELNLHNDSSQRELKQLVNSKQDMMVDENILKLELKRLRDQLNAKADKVMTLEQRRLQLETAMKERGQEIAIHKDMLRSQVKSANDERQNISSELHAQISKIDKLRKRYQIITVAMAPPEGEEEKSQAYYVIKAAQEKEELQREGDDLDAKIRKAEKEIRALENTLRLMNNRNETYRKSFHKVTESSEEMEDKAALDEQMRAVMDKYKYKKRQIRELQEDLQAMSFTLDNLTRDENVYVEMIDEKQNKIMQLSKELEEQKGKMERVTKQNSKNAREIRSAKKSKGETPEEKDFDVRDCREFTRSLTKMIGEAIQQHPDISPAVHLYFTQANMPPPPTPGHLSSGSSRQSSRMTSARSSLASVRSSKSGTPPSSHGRPATVDIGAAIAIDGSPASSRSSATSIRSGRK